MKRKSTYENDSKSKKPSLGPIYGPGATTSKSTLIKSATDLLPSIPATRIEATASALTAGLSVSVQLRPSHLIVLNYCYRTDRS